MTFRFLFRSLPAAALLAPCALMAEVPTLQSAIGDPTDFKLSGSARLRYETLDGQTRADLRPSDEQLDSRVTLFAEYAPGTVRFGAELYDSRAWLNKPRDSLDTTEVNTLELVQAYVAADFDAPFGAGSKASLQAGRFKLDLGSRRLIANDDYRNTTTGFTGIRADLRTAGGVTATAIYVLPQVRLPDDRASLADRHAQWDRESFDLQLWGGLIARPDTLAGATLEFGYFGLLERDWPGHATRNRDLDTFSARLIRDPKAGSFDFELEGFYQSGDIRTGTAPAAPEQAVGAWAMHGDAGYQFPGKAKLRLSLEYDRVSGDKAGGKYGRFDTLYGMRRADFGPAGIYNDVGRANIESLGLRAEIAPSPRFDAFATWHAMWLAEKTDAFSTTGVRDASGASGSFAGNQFDMRLRYWLVPKLLRAELNAVWLAKGRFLRDAPNAPDAGDTHYLAMAVTATF
ncbi:MAG: alginate export family protein [Candidatus Andeanibacterium colombiense]|uniref:Alginate export family protein n=1 Tax=Candidatus Andeanibacterium colombiense TaxID=3121345 RepID=A0AAJ5X4Y6_9SPHN|nr:MAG: alginate export family protein [Sphingomonadaceae bacterium]